MAEKMTEKEWLISLFEDVRAYFRYEAEPVRQRKEEAAMRETMQMYMEARDRGDFDDET